MTSVAPLRHIPYFWKALSRKTPFFVFMQFAFGVGDVRVLKFCRTGQNLWALHLTPNARY